MKGARSRFGSQIPRAQTRYTLTIVRESTFSDSSQLVLKEGAVRAPFFSEEDYYLPNVNVTPPK